MNNLTHVNTKGKANMVDVGAKEIQHRTAIASGKIHVGPETIRLIQENALLKGDVLTVARIAGIQAAKNTAMLIPLCHTLLLTKIDVTLELLPDAVVATSTVVCDGKTGVEMEALTAVSVALLTVYDMCKAVDKIMLIGDIKLETKTKETL
jgi:cyclic pyranopterin monophosphate synthase